MSDTEAPATRALSSAEPTPLARSVLAYDQMDLGRAAQHLYALLLRNVSSDGFPLSDSTHQLVSRPGCVIAAPSYPANAPGVSQDYVFNWVRDAAIVALEIAAATTADPGRPVEALNDYVRFADLCQRNAAPTMGHACFTIDGQPRPWSEQNDGPAVQNVALLASFDKLDPATQQTATELIGRNADFLLSCYRDQTTNLWEEHRGYSFFARAVQVRCFRALAENKAGVSVPAGVAEAIDWLQEALAGHWNGEFYATMLGEEAAGSSGTESAVPAGYDPNIDIVQACVYGALPCTDTKLLATAARLRRIWTDPDSPKAYPVNAADAERGLGPMLGRYPADRYDGGSGSRGDHPWPLCTANFAQLYFTVARTIESSGTLPLDDLSAPFFAQVGISADSTATDAVAALDAAGEAMLRAVLSHSDHLELSEQFDGVTGVERSVRDLTWSYAAFLSAVRARTGKPVDG